MSLSKSELGLLKLIAFRRQMNAPLDYHIVKDVWGEEVLGNLIKRHPFIKDDLDWSPDRLGIAKSKVEKVEELTNSLKVFKVLGFVKYVGISGSIAAGTYKPGDDIDLFIVVRDHTSWFYRGLLKVLLGDKARLVRHEDIGDKLCVNFICEERGLRFDDSIFTLHEFLHLHDVYNPEYRSGEFSAVNRWLEEYGVEGAGLEKISKPSWMSSIFWWPINMSAFLAQLMFMRLKKHSPEAKRYMKALHKGKIAFYPSQFHGEKVQAFEEEWEGLREQLGLPATSTTSA